MAMVMLLRNFGSYNIYDYVFTIDFPVILNGQFTSKYVSGQAQIIQALSQKGQKILFTSSKYIINRV
jgi:hypothetical protein